MKKKTGVILSSVIGVVAVGLVLAFLVVPRFTGSGQPLLGLQTVGADTYYYEADGEPASGFKTIDGNLYYFDPETGKAVVGWFTADDGTTYYFGEDGIAYTGTHTIDGEEYTFDEQGRLILEEDDAWLWRVIGGETYCIAPGGEYVTGLEKISGYWYYFNEEGVRQTGWHTIDGKLYYFDEDTGRAPKGWKTIGADTYYFDANGFVQTGQQTIGGQSFTFDNEGRLVKDAPATQRTSGGTAGGNAGSALPANPPASVVTQPESQTPAPPVVEDKGYSWKTEGGHQYYENAQGDRLKGLQTIGGSIYYFDSNGRMQTGWQTISGRLYFFDAEGRAQTGWAEQDGKSYYLCAAGYAVTGVKDIDGAKYYFDENGQRQGGIFSINGRTYGFLGANDEAITGWYPKEPAVQQVAARARMAASVQTDAETTYYFSNEYYALTGAQKIGNYWFGFDEKTGQLTHGWQRFGGKLYFFDERGGAAATETWKQHTDGTVYLGADGYALTGVQTIGGALYGFNGEGFRVSGWVKDGGNWYAFSGKDNAALTSQWAEKDGGWAYLDESGAAATGPRTVRVREGQGEGLYLFDSEGIALTGWQKDAEGRLYFLAEDGRAQYGEQTRGDDVYYMGENGYALTGLATIDGTLYYFGEGGIRQSGVVGIKGSWYGFLGENGAAVTGEATDGANAYWFRDDYTAYTGIQKIGDDWYGFSAAGVRLSGWQTDADGRLYYFKAQDGKAYTGWFVDVNAKARYYFTADGYALANVTETIDGVQYRFDKSGKLTAGGEAEGDWVTIGNDTYYMYKSGEYATGIVIIDNARYGFTATGERLSGWHEAEDGSHYYFGGENDEAVGGWLELNGKDYYFGADGIALTGLARIEEKDGTFLYNLGEDGARIEGEVTLAGRQYFFDPANGGRAHQGWHPAIETARARYYGDAGFALTGVQPIGDDETGYTTYWFDDAGQRQGGWLRSGSIYAFLGEHDAALVGEHAIDGKTYLFGEDSTATLGLYRGDAGLSYFDKDGARASGWLDYQNRRYWFDGNGIAPSGLKELDSHTYYFGDAGYILIDTTINTEDGWTYELDKDGHLSAAKATEGHKWREVEGQTYYMDSTGDVWTGLQEIEGGLYYLSEAGGFEKGARQYGWQDVGGARYWFGEDGRAILGWFTDDATGRSYYFDDEYHMVTGTHVIEYVTYEFDSVDGHLTSGEPPVFNEWGQDGDDVFYLDASGKRAVGLATIAGELYYFNDRGVLQTGPVDLEAGHYFFDPENGGKAARGWTLMDGVWYCFDNTTGVQQTGWRYRVDENGVQCSHYFYADGTAPQGFVTLEGVKRYFYEDGRMALDWQTIGDARYYFYTDTGRMATGVSQIGDAWFSFDAEGRQVVGFNTDVDGRRYYFGEDGMATGWQQVEGVWYSFNASGVQQVGWQTREDDSGKYIYYYDGAGNVPGEGWQAVSGITRYFFADGQMAQGFTRLTDGLYYFYDNGTIPTAPATVDGVYYPFDAQGRLETGWYQNGANRYHYTDDGALRGWHMLEDRWVYFGEANGRQQYGWQERTADGKTFKHYYYNDGSQPTGWNSDIDGVKRYFFADGAMAMGWCEVEGTSRYFFADGSMAGGVVVIDGVMRAFDANGAPATGWCYDSAGNRYNFTADGALKGWQQLDGKWYHFDSETAVQRTGWQARTEGSERLQYYYHDTGDTATPGWTDEIDGVGRYILPDGSAAQGWQTIDGTRYLLDDKGAAGHGWVESGGRWYLLDEATGAQKTGWHSRTADGTTHKYFYAADGSLPEAGWATVDGAKRYIQADGSVASGWLKVGSYTYYFDDGVYRTGSHTIDGKVCRFDSTGAYIVAPVINSVTHKAASGSTHTVTVAATANTALQSKSLSYSFDGGKTWQSAASKDFAAGTNLAANTIQVKDAVGNVTSYGTALQLGTAANYQSYGIDVSVYQGKVDWAKVKASGVEFAIVRSLTHNGTNYIIDPYFEYNVRQAKANGIKVGTYLYCYAYNIWGIENEVDIFYDSAEMKRLMAEGIYFDLPVYIDYEDPYVLNHTQGMSKAGRTAIARRGLEKITERSGGKHMPGIYSYYYFLRDSIDGKALENEGYEMWVADYRGSCGWTPRPPIWQYSSTGRVAGIGNGATNVDLNYCYKDYSKYIDPGKNVSGGSSGGGTTVPVHNLTVTNQYGTVVTASAESILAQIVEAEMGGFASSLTAAQTAEVFKAQAMAAQSWILYNNGRGVAAPQVALKTPSAAAQNAAAQVVGKKMTYGGANVCSTYFATSGSYNGKIMTNNSGYWGSNHAYLSSVTSTESRALTSYSGSISNANLRARIIAIYGSDLTVGKDPSTWIKVEARNAAGYVTKVSVCGRYPSIDYFYQTFMRGATTTGSKINSPAFTFSYANGNWSYSYTGAGHAIGMSQWGAYDMAKAGHSYEAILKHYYTGVVITNV